MPDLKKQMTQAQIAEQVANLFGSYIDRPNDPNARGSLRSDEFNTAFRRLVPPWTGYTPADIGILQQNPQYRGIRMVMPQSGGSYGEFANQAGGMLGEAGLPRIITQGPIGEPDPLDPHNNNIMRYPPNEPPDRGGLREMIYGHLIARGYPVYGGTGDIGGDFQPGFNPVGFGQRDIPLKNKMTSQK